MAWLLPEADLDQGGGTPHEDSPTPPLTASRDEELLPIAVLQDTRTRLLAALEDPAIPPGTLCNILSSLAKIAIALAEVDHAYEPPEIVYVDPHSDQWHDVHLVLTRALTRIMELHQEAEGVLAALDEQLSQFDHAVAVRTREIIRLATRHLHTAIAEKERQAAVSLADEARQAASSPRQE